MTAVDRAKERKHTDVVEYVTDYKPLPRGMHNCLSVVYS